MEEPIERVRKTKEYKAQVEKGIDVESLLTEVQKTQRFLKYGKTDATAYSIMMSVVIPVYDVGTPFDEELMVFSSFDKYGNDTKFPTRFVALRKNKTFCTVDIFDVNSIEVPCKCRVVGGLKTNSYGSSVRPSDGGITRVEPVSYETIQTALSKVAIDQKKAYTFEDVLSGVAKGSEIRAVKTTIKNVVSSGIWGEDETTGKRKITGHNPVMMPDQRKPEKLHPMLEMSLDYTGGYDVTAILSRQRFGNPIYKIDEFEDICKDALEIEKPEEQADLIRSVVIGREIFVIMEIWQSKVSGKDDKRFVKGNAMFIMEVIPEAAQATIHVEEEPQPSSSLEHVENPFVEALVKACETLNQDPKFVPVAKAREIASIGADVSDNMVQEMTKRASQVWNERKGA